MTSILPSRPTACPGSSNARAGANLLWLATLALTIGAVYAGSLRGEMIFDDLLIIAPNPSIHSLRHLGQVLNPPHDGSPVQGRPMVNLSLAINYALGREEVFGYHLFNVFVHVVNALLVFGIVRRTLRLPAIASHIAERSRVLAFVVALLWGVHPLATAAVDYISQRTELLVSLFYMLTVYCVIRSHTGRAWLWQIAAAVACLLGMASKEVMVSAPLVVLIYDRVFLSQSWKETFRQRGILYAALAATWILLGALMISNGTRNHSVGFGGEISVWNYALTQCRALVLYLKLCFWPAPLVFDYGTEVIAGPKQVWPQALLLLVLVIGVALALLERPLLGFMGLAWFAILAPTSSIVPIRTQVIGEHRAYLPLAVGMVIVVVAAYHCGRALAPRLAPAACKTKLFGWGVSAGVTVAAAVALSSLTVLRHRDYRTKLEIWNDVIRKCPSNARAHNSRGDIFYSSGRYEQAIADYDRAITLKPNDAAAYNNRACAYNSSRHYDEAIADATRALQLRPNYAAAYYNRGNAYYFTGACDKAIADYDAAIQLKPEDAAAYKDRGSAYAYLGRYEQAIADYTHAVQLDPAYADAYDDRGSACNHLGRYEQAIADTSRAIQLIPNLALAYYNRGNALDSSGRYPEALADYGRAIELNRGFAEAYCNRSVVYFRLRDYDDAWTDINQCRRYGGVPNPELVKRLTNDSGRSE